MYTIKLHNLEKYYFMVDAKLLQLVTNLPNTRKNKSYSHVLLFNAWGCAKDAILLELRLNLDLESGLV